MLQGSFVNGVEDGTWAWWHRNGNKEKEAIFQNGENLNGWTKWSESGEKMN
jgi:antitoxin component YwqK of YwqJK toxin-antitoxin module